MRQQTPRYIVKRTIKNIQGGNGLANGQSEHQTRMNREKHYKEPSIIARMLNAVFIQLLFTLLFVLLSSISGFYFKTRDCRALASLSSKCKENSARK